MNTEALALADDLRDHAIEILRRNPKAPKLSLDEWEQLFASVHQTWMSWLPDYLDELVEEETL